jgi:hypothetical protein
MPLHQITFGILCLAAAISVSSAEGISLENEQLANKFSMDLKASQCVTLTRNQLTDKSLQGLDQLLGDLVQGLNQKNAKALKPLFHERLNIDELKLESVFSLMDRNYGHPFDVSLFEAYLLHSVEGKAAYIPCEKSRLEVLPQYGYDMQVVLWLQIMGKNEVGRLITALVPTKNGWRLGSFHSWQWTHESKDYTHWFAEAAKYSEAKNYFAAYFHAAIASKLLEASPYMKFADQEPLAKFKAELFPTEEQLLAAFKGLGQLENLGYVGSSLSDGGIGLVLRFAITEELSSMAMRTDCEEKAKRLLATAGLEFLQGVRCSYNLPKDPLTKDGSFGSQYFPRAPVPGKAKAQR